MQLYVLGRNEKILGTLTNEGLDSPNLLAAEEFKALNGVDTLKLTVTNTANFVREENYVIYKNEKHEWEVFTIRENPGVGRKATWGEPVIGFAIENFGSNSVGKIKVKLI